MRYQPPVTREESFGNVKLVLLGGEAPVFCEPRSFLSRIDDYESVEVVLLLNGAHRVTPKDLEIEGFPQWDEYAQFPSGGYISWQDVAVLRAALLRRAVDQA